MEARRRPCPGPVLSGDYLPCFCRFRRSRRDRRERDGDQTVVLGRYAAKWGLRPRIEAAVCEKTKPVVLEVREPAAGALDLLHQKIHGFRRSIAGTGAVVVDHLRRPALERASETTELGNLGRLALLKDGVEEALCVVGVLDCVDLP